MTRNASSTVSGFPRNRFRPGNVGIVIAIVLMLTSGSFSVAYAGSWTLSTPVAASERTDHPEFPMIKPDLQEQIATQVDEHLPNYTIDVSLIAEPSPSLNGTVVLDYVNTTGDDLTEVPFRLYANGVDSENDEITVNDVTVDDQPVDAELRTNDSVLIVPLGEPLAEHSQITIALSFEASVPLDTSDHYGIFGVDSVTGTWALAHWYPILAGWDATDGWELDPVSRFGDPIFSTTSTYDVSITTPADWQVVTTGAAIDDELDGDTRTRRIQSGPVRDFTIVADSDYKSTSRIVEGTTITSWFNPGSEEVGETVLDYAAQALSLYNKLIGPYPYTEFDVVPVELYGAAGVEFPQLIYIAQSYYGENQDLSVPNYLDFTVAHEVLHQWWYGVVGNNQYNHAFIDEGLTNFVSSKVYFSETYGSDIGDIMYAESIESSFVSVVRNGDDQIVDTPTDDFPSGQDYAWAAYSKAPVGFNAIYEEIGPDAFFEGLSAYFDEFAFQVAQPEDLLQAFSDASGEDLTDLWDHWFKERAGEDDV